MGLNSFAGFIFRINFYVTLRTCLCSATMNSMFQKISNFIFLSFNFSKFAEAKNHVLMNCK